MDIHAELADTDHKPFIVKDLVSLWGRGECGKVHYLQRPSFRLILRVLNISFLDV